MPDPKLDNSPREVDCEGKACHDREASCERECLIKKADSVLEKLRVCFFNALLTYIIVTIGTFIA